MANTEIKGVGTKQDPWQLTTPSGSSEYLMYRDQDANPPALVCLVGKTELRYHLRCIEDLHTMLKAHGDWILLGSADEQKPATPGTVEAWGRFPSGSIGKWDSKSYQAFGKAEYNLKSIQARPHTAPI